MDHMPFSPWILLSNYPSAYLRIRMKEISLHPAPLAPIPPEPPPPVPTSTPHPSLSGSIEQRWQILFCRFQVGQRTIRIWGLWVGNILKMKMKSLNEAIKRVKQSRAFFSNLAPFLKIWMTFSQREIEQNAAALKGFPLSKFSPVP